MKYLFLSLLLLSAPVFSAEEPRSIQVSGEGTVQAEPDQVKLQFGIESADRNLIKAKDDNTQKTKKLLEALKKFNIPAADIQTGYVQINPRYDYNSGKQIFTGYVVMKQLSVTIKNLNDYGKILNAVIEAGVDHVNGLQFENSKAEELKMEAKKRAVTNAKAKAEILAAQLNQKIGPPLFIQDAETPVVMPMYRRGMRADAMSMKAVSPEDTLSPGETTIQASVTIRFLLQ